MYIHTFRHFMSIGFNSVANNERVIHSITPQNCCRGKIEYMGCVCNGELKNKNRLASIWAQSRLYIYISHNMYSAIYRLNSFEIVRPPNLTVPESTLFLYAIFGFQSNQMNDFNIVFPYYSSDKNGLDHPSYSTRSKNLSTAFVPFVTVDILIVATLCRFSIKLNYFGYKLIYMDSDAIFFPPFSCSFIDLHWHKTSEM